MGGSGVLTRARRLFNVAAGTILGVALLALVIFLALLCWGMNTL